MKVLPVSRAHDLEADRHEARKSCPVLGRKVRFKDVLSKSNGHSASASPDRYRLLAMSRGTFVAAGRFCVQRRLATNRLPAPFFQDFLAVLEKIYRRSSRACPPRLIGSVRPFISVSTASSACVCPKPIIRTSYAAARKLGPTGRHRNSSHFTWVPTDRPHVAILGTLWVRCQNVLDPLPQAVIYRRKARADVYSCKVFPNSGTGEVLPNTCFRMLPS